MSFIKVGQSLQVNIKVGQSLYVIYKGRSELADLI